jgi:hypothetical protein
MTTRKPTAEATEEPPPTAAQDFGSFDFRSETIEEISQLASVAWFPLTPRAEAEQGKLDVPGKVAGSEVSLVATARELGIRARAGDHDALLRLFVMMAGAQLELWKLSKESKLLRRAAEHSAVWFLPRSPFRGLAMIFKEFEAFVNVAGFLLRVRRMHASLDVPVNACAFKLITYMVLAKRRLITNPRYTGWVEECEQLPKLSQRSWTESWWPLGIKIAKDMFPDLDQMLFGQNADPKDKDRNLDAAIHHLGMACKSIWLIFKGIEDAAIGMTSSLTAGDDKKNRKQ